MNMLLEIMVLLESLGIIYLAHTALDIVDKGDGRMKNKINYKQKYEKLLLSLDVDNKINIHKNSWKFIGRLFLLIGSILLAVLNFFVLISNWKILNISEIFKNSDEMNMSLIGFYQFEIIPHIIFQYCLIGLVFICLVALIKGGFKNLKSIKELGLIGGLIVGLIGGLIIGLIIGLIGGLIFGLFSGLISEFKK